MDTKQILSVLTGMVVATGTTLGVQEVLNEEPILEGEEKPIVEEVPAIQPIIWVDDTCGENSLKLQLGESTVCTSNELYAELKATIVADLKEEKFSLQLADGTPCEEESEECKKVPYQLELGNRELFGAFLIKEMLKDGEVKSLPEDAKLAKEEALKILEGEELEIIK